MISLTETIDILLTPGVLRAAAAVTIFTIVSSWVFYRRHQIANYWIWTDVVLCMPAGLAIIWLYFVNEAAPDPYLDEVFHIPQVQTYCEGKYFQWDDKITTPPGLYAATIIWARILGYNNCEPANLRSFNVFAIGCLSWVVKSCRQAIERANGGQATSSLPPHATATALGASLFPVLFFFSGLYYTDVLSTLAVLYAYLHHLKRMNGDIPPDSPRGHAGTIFWGLLALTMRQTNIFWVVIYLGGLEATQAVKELPQHRAATGANYLSWLQRLWQNSGRDIRDPTLDQVGSPLNVVPCVIPCVISIAAAILLNPLTVLSRIYPRLLILGSFVGFVAWNGGVVLGDKANHIATVHLAQLLYLWPMFLFFSWPLLMPSLALELYRRCRSLGQVRARMTTQTLSKLVAGTTLVAMAVLVVRYNTIIHPFTLADNRHYMFYVFRYTILRGQLARLFLAPCYVACGVVCLDGLYLFDYGAPAPHSNSDQKPKACDPEPAESIPPRVSSLMIWILATALSLVSAPLVEPRYFILPWVFWRLMVPAPRASSVAILCAGDEKQGEGETKMKLAALRLMGNILEVCWFLAINLATMYIFVTRPFYWRDGDGVVVDGAKVQRFMW